MVRDLRELLEALVQHDIVAAMARDPGASAALRTAGTDVELPELDAVPPDQEFLVLDADSTQQRAVGHALIGRNGVISGPPGTGKSQTIANLICEFAARGKKVLFVAEKRAALEAVLKRLEKKGLAHLCLDLHGAEVSRRQVLERVAVALEKIRDAQKVDPAAVHQRFVERRTRLNEHARRLHVTRKPSDLSIFQLQGRLLRMEDTSCPVRWRGDALKALTSDRRRQIIGLLEEAAGFPGLFTGRDPGPWTHAVVNDAAEAQRAFDRATDVARSVTPVVERARAACRELGLTEGATIADAVERVSVIVDIHECLRRLDVRVFSGRPVRLRPLWRLPVAAVASVGDDDGLGISRGAVPGPRFFDRHPIDRPLICSMTSSKPKISERAGWPSRFQGHLHERYGADPAVLLSQVSTFTRAVADLSRFFPGVDGSSMTVDGLRDWTEASRLMRSRHFASRASARSKPSYGPSMLVNSSTTSAASIPPPQTWSSPLRLCLAEIFSRWRLRRRAGTRHVQWPESSGGG